MIKKADPNDLEDMDDVAVEMDESIDSAGADAVYDDDLANDTWDDGQEPAARPVKKKSGLFNVILITLGVVVIAGLVYAKFMMPKPRPATISAEQTQARGPETPVVDNTAVPPAAPLDPGAATPPPPPAETAIIPTPPAIEPPGGAEEMPVVPPVDIGEGASPAPGLTPMPDFPAQPVPPVETAAAPEPAPATPAAPVLGETPSSTAAPEGTATASAADNQRLQVLEDRLAQLNRSVSETQGLAQAVQKLADQVAALNNRFATLEAGTTTGRRLPPHPPADLAPQAPASVTEPSALPSNLPPKAVSLPAPSGSRARWVLRAVGNGKAYLAPAGSGAAAALTTVGVGDQIDGLGTIKSIEMKNGRWVVQGTKGRASQ